MKWLNEGQKEVDAAEASAKGADDIFTASSTCHQGLTNTNRDETCLDTKKPTSYACPHFHQDGATDHPWTSDGTHTMVLQLIVSHVAIWSSH